MTASDVTHICDYWLLSDDDYLKGMGVDLAKVPSREELSNMLNTQLQLPLSQRQSFALIWLLNGNPFGHCNVNQIEFGKRANMHLHIWSQENRNKGIGTALLKLSIPIFFEELKLSELYCEPYAFNPAPNKILKSIGFEFIKKYMTIPGSINFEQEVNQWRLKH
ncbi:MAG: GNAT family N-acetyltransferase [Bacteroidia bacterium]